MKELKKFMELYKYDEIETSRLLGVTYQAVKLWLNGQRSVPKTTIKILKLLTENPSLIERFKVL